MERNLLKSNLKESVRSLAGIVLVGGIFLTPVVKESLKRFDYERKKVLEYYDKNNNDKIEKEEKEKMIEDLGGKSKKNYDLKKEDFDFLYGKIK